MENRPLVIGVAGGSGSGKTTVMNAILDRVGHERVAVLPHDAYYRDLAHLAHEERAQVNFDHPDAFDNTLYLAHLHALTNGQQVTMPTYDFANYVRLPEVLNVLNQQLNLAWTGNTSVAKAIDAASKSMAGLLKQSKVIGK